MKEKKKFAGILLIILSIVIMQLPVSRADAASSASDFQVEGSTLVKYRGSGTSVTVPSTIETIGKSAFENNGKIELVVLPKSVKKIEEYAFWGCDRLDTVTLNTGLTEVADFAFANCKGLTKMTIPDSVRYIGIDAFQDCVNMKDITIPPETIGIHETAFDGCYQLTIHAQAGSYADKYAQDFYERQKEMPEYEDVDNYSPQDTTGVAQEDLTTEDPVWEEPSEKEETETIVVPVAPEGTGAILGTTQVVGNQAVVFIDNTKPTVLDNLGGMQPQDEEVRQAVENNLVQTGSLPKLTIVDGRIVADQAYYRMTDLNQVFIPAGITQIGEFSFARSSIEAVTVSEGVRKIDYGAFYHCDNLVDVQLPDTIENVEPKAFAYTKWVEQFLHSKEKDFLISGTVLVAYAGEGGQVVIPEGVKVIAGEAFLGETDITSIVLPDSLITIGEGAFENCVNLTSVSFGTNLQKIKDRAFYGCPLDPVVMPGSLLEVGLKAFDERVTINYTLGEPTHTYETSAQRLSNEEYREYAAKETEGNVLVEGLEHAYASLEGATREYLLTVEEGAEASAFENAYRRIFGEYFSGDLVLYQMTFTDESQIPLTKLGKRNLTVTLDVPEQLESQNIQIYTLDANGQLELVSFERAASQGTEQVRVQLKSISCLALCGDGSEYDSDDLLTEFTDFYSMSGGQFSEENNSEIVYLLKWSVVILLFLTGLLLVVVRKRNSV